LLVQGLDVGTQDAAGGTGVEVDFGGNLAGAPFRVGRASSAGGVAGQGLVVFAARVTVIRASSG